MKYFLTTVSILFLAGCLATDHEFSETAQPASWGAYESSTVPLAEASMLAGWWKKFEDPALNQLVDLSLNDSPDRLIAEARLQEARGLRRTARSSLFPQIGATAQAGRADDALSPADNAYEAGFDASFEIDLFGRNRKSLDAADAQIEALAAEYQNATLSLIAEITRTYIEFRAAQQQASIAQKNLDAQEKTLQLIQDQRNLGAATQLDVERSESQVNTTKASIPEFKRLADNARLRLTVLSGRLPADISRILENSAPVPAADVQPVLMVPAQVLAQRPDIQAAAAYLRMNMARADATAAEIFPTVTIGGFYGVADNAILSSATIWNVALGAAISLLDFGRIEGRIDAAKAQERQAYEQYRKVVLSAVVDVETALGDYARLNERRISLQKARDNADKALQLSQELFREGEVSFLDVLVAQRTVNETDSALISAQLAQTESLVRLHKALGVY